MMKFQLLIDASLSIMLGVTSVASQESESRVGTDQKLIRAVDFLKQAAQEINKLSNETDCGCEKGEGQFCGVDGQCHFYSCLAWYEFGPIKFTGYHHNTTSTPSGPLDCQDISFTQPYQPNDLIVESDIYYPSVSFRCDSLTLTPPPIAMGFNRRCSAKSGPHKASDFTCYELAVPTDFQPFLDNATSANLECTDNGADGTTELPKFVYSATVESEISTDGHTKKHEAFKSTDVLDENLALIGTMYAKYEEKLTDPPTASPTEMPTEPPTTTPTKLPTQSRTSTAPIQTGNSALLAAIFLIASLVHF